MATEQATKSKSEKEVKRKAELANEHDEPTEAHGHDHADKGLAHHAAHAATKKEIWTIFFVLCGLTGLELGVVYLHVGRTPMYVALIGLALAKAYFVAMFYMHLKGETKTLKTVVYFPMVFPALYAVVLMGEAIYRMLGKVT